jgi:BirA family biotin operon repressor/biotin-[acetyl-CoA-carboxylase] ligase
MAGKRLLMIPVETHLRIIRVLADGEHHSGEALAGLLGVSRSAVRKAVHRAAGALGLEVRAQRGHGYRLARPMELLDAERILGGLTGGARRRIRRLELFDDIPSTNAHLMREGQAGAPSGTLCLAERQSAGRGRRGRSWVSPFGHNIYLSLLWRYGLAPGELGGLSLAAGSTVAGVLEDQGVEGVALKWPNDVLWRGRKLAGLLLEVAAQTHGPSLVVLGLGLNTRLQGEQAKAIDQPWVDLEEILGPRGYSRNGLAVRLVEDLTAAMERYDRDGIAPFLPLWERFDRYRGEPVELRLGDQVLAGVQEGVTPGGALRLRVGSVVRTFVAGEVSLRHAPSRGGGRRT